MINPIIKTIQVDQVSVDGPHPAKNGKEYWKVGVNTPNGWLNNIFWDKKHIDILNDAQGKTLEVLEFDEEYNDKIYKKFKLPSRTDMLDIRVKNLEDRLDKASGIIAELMKMSGAQGNISEPTLQAQVEVPEPTPSYVPPEPDPMGYSDEPDDLPF